MYSICLIRYVLCIKFWHRKSALSIVLYVSITHKCFILVDVDVLGFLSTPMVINEEDENVQILVGVLATDGRYNNDTIVVLNIEDQSEGT